MTEPLQLRAEDAGDIAVISACLQDALIELVDMCWLEDERRFVLVASRFAWERPRVRKGKRFHYERVHCGVAFEEVTRVRMRGINRPADGGRALALLAVSAEDGGIHLLLAGGAEVRIEMAAINCRLKDVGEPWPVIDRPRHPVEEER
jgi:hypothetical protein